MKKFIELFIKFLIDFFNQKDSIQLPNEQTKWEQLIKQYASMNNIADHFRIASLAQWILESGRGESLLAEQANNFAGLKWRPEMKSHAEPMMIKVPSETLPVEFCKFKDIESFINGYWRFIDRAPYNGWGRKITAEDYIDHLWLSGYAVDKFYPQKVKSLFKEARKLLVDAGAKIDDPDRPDDPIGSQKYDIPEMKMMDVEFDNQGEYLTPTGKASGLVVHYTVSGRSARSALGVGRYMASKGLGCLIMDEDGIIYYPRNWSRNRWLKRRDDHAGKSSWGGKSSVSRYFMGMEICSWGAAGQQKGADDIRRIAEQHDNQAPGLYQKFTARQEQALINFCLWQLDTNPEFRIENIVGHDEVSPGRKIDPGGSLSMSMPEFRQYLRAML